jgi:hypothetical protein
MPRPVSALPALEVVERGVVLHVREALLEMAVFRTRPFVLISTSFADLPQNTLTYPTLPNYLQNCLYD